LLRGVNSLSDIELIEILVGSGVKESSFKKISKRILVQIQKNRGDSVSLDSLTCVHGVGEILAMKILGGIELGRRIDYSPGPDVVRITQSKEAYEVFKDIGNMKKERVDILCLNSRFEVLVRETVAIGGLNSANILPRDIIYPAIAHNSAFVVMAHNHPSGDSSPSEEDISLTKRIVVAMEIVGLQLLDHIVVSKNGWSSIDIDG